MPQAVWQDAIHILAAVERCPADKNTLNQQQDLIKREVVCNHEHSLAACMHDDWGVCQLRIHLLKTVTLRERFPMTSSTAVELAKRGGSVCLALFVALPRG